VTGAALDQYLYLLDEAFEGGRWHSLLGNLDDTSAADWEWIPPAGSRSVRAIAQHVGECKRMYENHAFGDGKLSWNDFSPDLTGTRTRAIQFLRESQERLRTSIAALGEDSELLKPRKTNWGEMKETRWIIAQLIEHDHYHAGEINHIRSLRTGDDRWAHERSV